MHSRVYQLVTKPEDSEENLDYFEWFFPGVADYYRESESEREDDYEFLQNNLGVTVTQSKIDMSLGKFVITRNDIAKLDRKIYDNVKSCLDPVIESLQTYETFNKTFGPKMYQMAAAYNDKYGIYFIYNGCLITFDEFIRWLYNDFHRNGNKELHFYIKNIYDYHS